MSNRGGGCGCGGVVGGILLLGLAAFLWGYHDSPKDGSAPTDRPAVAVTPIATLTQAGDPRFLLFNSHLSTSTTAFGDLAGKIVTDSKAAKITTKLKSDGAKLRSLATAELAWLAANPYGDCYLAVWFDWQATMYASQNAGKDLAAGHLGTFTTDFADATGAAQNVNEEFASTRANCGA